jgi:NAD(P)-dependent dehydrogenase (short-subunit alcohol dehydrogenase family)
MTAQLLANRKALVTGSVTGIGQAIAERLAQAGAGIVAHGRHHSEVGQRAAEWRARGFDVCVSAADLSEAGGVVALTDDLQAWGAPDIVVLNASIEISETWDEVCVEAMQRQSTVNLHSSLQIIQAFLPAMLARGWGRILAVGSVQEERPNKRHIVYAATKAAQTSVILNMARNVRAPNVTFNVLKPGVIETNRNQATLSDPAKRRDILARIPAGRLGQPGDCAGAALLLCSDDGSYINGAELHVDGGFRL